MIAIAPALLAAVLVCVLIRRENELRRINRVAEAAQRVMLRSLPAQAGGFSFAHRCRSAAPGARVGGDLYDMVMTPAGPRLIIGDVKGNGLAALGLAAATLRAFRETAYDATDLSALAARLDARLACELGPEDFVSVVLAELGPGEIRLVNCGHHPPVRVGCGLEELEPPHPQPPLGLHPVPVQRRARLGPGERVLFFTDGLTEARGPDGGMFALGERAREALTAPLPEDALDALLSLVDTHTRGRLRDDLALVLIQPLPAPPAPASPAEMRQPTASRNVTS